MTFKTWAEIWAERPNKGKLSSFEGGIISPHFTEIYDAEEIDAFHDQVKAAGDELRRKLGAIKTHLDAIPHDDYGYDIGHIGFQEFIKNLYEILGGGI